MVGLPCETLVAGDFVWVEDSAIQVVLVDAVQDLPWQLAAVEVAHTVRLE